MGQRQSALAEQANSTVHGTSRRGACPLPSSETRRTSMAIWIFEDTIGGGRFARPGAEPADASLRREGRAMVRALVESFSPRLKRELRVAWDSAAGEIPHGVAVDWIDHSTALDRWFRQACDSSSSAGEGPTGLLIIAPESDLCLLHWVELAERFGASLLSPDSRFVALAGDKTATRQWLIDREVPVPRHSASGADGDEAWIIKPRDGCGSQQVLRHRGARDEEPSAEQWPRDRWHVEPLVAGQAVSVACLGSRHGFRLLPPVTQSIDTRKGFAYGGGTYPLPNDLAARATHLARLAVAALPSTQGYFGLDLMLGATEADDVVIEVNPRLTTSYVALARRVGPWLGDSMCGSIGRGEGEGRTFVPELTVDARPLSFEPTGLVKE